MSSAGCSNNSGFCNNSLARHICEFIGKPVTIFTTSGGMSGCGFTGVVLSVNSCFVRLITEQGTPPSIPLSEGLCGALNSKSISLGVGGGASGPYNGQMRTDPYRLGSVCDIPIENIAAFCHNAV